MITFFNRYQIDAAGFDEYACAWDEAIPRCGVELTLCCAPHGPLVQT